MRTITITKELYQFSELSDRAKEEARDWYRQLIGHEFADFHAEAVYEWVREAGALLGIQIGKDRYDITWSGFCSQGDGAAFKATYRYAKGSVAKVKKMWPEATRLHEIAEQLYQFQKARGYKVEAEIDNSGRYFHLDVSSNIDDYSDHKEFRDIMDDFASWIYRSLEEEHNYQMADDQIDEGIEANDYEFLENGKRA